MIILQQLSLKTVVQAAVVIYALRWILISISHALRARRMGCKPAFVRPSKIPFGIDILKRYMDMSREQILQNDDLILYEELGRRSTWNQNILGTWFHVTVDPKNVQAMLATQFKDFELGPLRRNLFNPVIGKGIFTTDGKDWYVPNSQRGRPQELILEIGNILEPFFARNLLEAKCPTYSLRNVTFNTFSIGSQFNPIPGRTPSIWLPCFSI